MAMPEELVDDGFRINAREVDPDAVLIDIAGDIDMQSAPGATAFLTEAMATSPRHLILDLSAVTFLASAGINLLIAAQSGGKGIRGQLHLLGVTDNLQVQRPLALVGLLDRFDIAPDLHTLLARLDTIDPWPTEPPPSRR